MSDIVFWGFVSEKTKRLSPRVLKLVIHKLERKSFFLFRRNPFFATAERFHSKFQDCQGSWSCYSDRGVFPVVMSQRVTLFRFVSSQHPPAVDAMRWYDLAHSGSESPTSVLSEYVICKIQLCLGVTQHRNTFLWFLPACFIIGRRTILPPWRNTEEFWPELSWFHKASLW
jgi:hypothetical protein